MYFFTFKNPFLDHQDIGEVFDLHPLSLIQYHIYLFYTIHNIFI